MKVNYYRVPTVNYIDKIYTTEVITQLRGGCANRHRGVAKGVYLYNHQVYV